MRPVFGIGDVVLYQRKNKRGVVQGIINIGEIEDIKTQGYRYYVLIQGEVWSIRQQELLLEKKHSNNNTKRIEATFILPVGGSVATREAVSSVADPLTILIASEEKPAGTDQEGDL